MELRDRLTAVVRDWANDTEMHVDGPITSSAVEYLAESLIDIIAEGADFASVPDAVEHTPEQLWAWLLNADPAERLKVLTSWRNAAYESNACWQEDHRGRIKHLTHLTRALNNR